MTGKIKLVHSGGNSVSVAVPTNAPSASEVEFKLPQADASANQVLKTDGSGNLSFAADAGGKIIGQYFSTSTSEFSSSSGSFQNAHTITFTPASSTSKFLIFYLPARVTFGSNPDGEFRISDGSNTTNQYRIAGGSHGNRCQGRHGGHSANDQAYAAAHPHNTKSC